MHSTEFVAGLLSGATLISLALASPVLDARTAAKRGSASGSSQPGLAVYWGNGSNQQRLAEFCQDTTMDIIPIGFVNVFPDQAGANGYPGTNYANACGGDLWVAPDGTETQMFKNCYQIEEDIPVCQALGKKILASIGGASPGNFIASATSAKDFADFLWGSFGPAQDNSYYLYPRPFGINVTVDGFDLDIESGGDFGYADLVNELRAKFEGQPKQYYISSAPQCITLDPHLGDAIANADFDYVFVQYYNNDRCSARSLFGSGSLNTTADPSGGWADWLQTYSKNKNVKLFVGLPASTDAAHSTDYLNLDEAQALIEAFSCGSICKSTFGGVMLWEATDSANNQINGLSYASNIKNILAGLSCAPGYTTTSTSTTTTIASTSTAAATTPPLTTTTTTVTVTTITTTAWSSPTGPIGGHTTLSDNGSSVTTTTTSWSSSLGPVGDHTTSSASPSTTSETTTVSSSSYSHPVGPIGGTVSSSTTTKTTTTEVTTTTQYSFSHPVGPIGGTTSTWTTTTTTNSITTSVEAGPGHASSSSPSTTAVAYPTSSVGPWDDWTTSTTTTFVVDPESATKTTVVSWEDWSSSTALQIQTIVPVKPSALADHPIPTSTLATAISTDNHLLTSAAVSPSLPSNWQNSTNAAPSVVAPAVTSLARSSSSPIPPINVAPFTGGATQGGLPGTVLSVCIVFAIAGLLF